MIALVWLRREGWSPTVTEESLNERIGILVGADIHLRAVDTGHKLGCQNHLEDFL